MRQAPAVRARSSTELKMSLFGLGVPELAVIGVLAVGQMIYPQISFNMHIYKMDLAMRLCVYLSLSVSIYLICNYLLIYPSTTHLFSSLSLVLPPSHAPSFGFLCLSSHTHSLYLSDTLFLSLSLRPSRSLSPALVRPHSISFARTRYLFLFLSLFPAPSRSLNFSQSLSLAISVYIHTNTHPSVHAHTISLSLSNAKKHIHTQTSTHTHKHT